MTVMIARLLDLHRDDLRRGFPLFACLFLITASQMMGKVARDALFLDKFPPQQLPYVDLAIVAVVGLVVAVHIRLGRYVTLSNLLAGSLLVFAATTTVFWWLTNHPSFWFYSAFYVWVGLFSLLATQVWTLTSAVLTTRKAKRLFGLVGSGPIIGGLSGGFLSNVVAKAWGTESLLLVIACCLALCAILVMKTWRQQHAFPSEQEQPALNGVAGPRNLHKSIQLVRESPYLQAIAGVICISSIVTAVVSWQFKAVAQEFYPRKDELAAFFGNFYGYAGVFTLAVQLLLTSRLLRRFGLGTALFILPIALTVGSAGVLMWGTLIMAIWLRGSDNVFGYSIDKSTVELLYLPVPSGVKMQVKAFIDVVIGRLGDGLAGFVVLIFATFLHVTARQISAVNLILLGVWFIVAYVAWRQYIATLSENIQQYRLDAEHTAGTVLDRSAADVLAARLNAGDAKEILYALSLFELEHHATIHPAVRDLLRHPSAEVRQRALSVLNAAEDTSVQPQVEALLQDEHIGVRTEALLYLAHHAHIDPLLRIQELGDFPNFSVRSAMVACLAWPGRMQNLDAARIILDTMVQEQGPAGQQARLEAGRLISMLPDHFEEPLDRLIDDPDTEVARQAIRAAGVLHKRRFVPLILSRLNHPDLASDAVEVLGAFGDRIVGTLRDYLFDASVPISARREIPSILMRIGTPAAERVLIESLLTADAVLRTQVIVSLNGLHRHHPEFDLDTQMIETVLAAEIIGHYRSYQVLGRLRDTLPAGSTTIQAIYETMHQGLERVFWLIALQYPRYDLHSAYVGFQSDNPVVQDNALEFLENVLKPQLRSLLLPLLDHEVTFAERVQLADRVIGTSVETNEEAIATLMSSEDPYLKSCAAYAIGTLGLKALEPELDRCLTHPDPLLRETARQAKLRITDHR